MYILRIEHAVPSFEGWKKAFDNDPLDRETSGVRNHRIFRSIDQPDHVLIDLEFDSVDEAEAMRTALHRLWKGVAGTIMVNPQTQIVEVFESTRY